MQKPENVYWYQAQPEERALLSRIAAGNTRNSSWTLVSGNRSAEFHDVDDALTGEGIHRGITTVEKDISEHVRAYTEVLSHQVRQAVDRYDISRLAFIDKGPMGGPVGTLGVLAATVERTGMQAVIVRPRRRFRGAEFKGAPVTEGERFLVVSDVATSGAGIAAAADIIWQRGGRVPVAVVVYDRNQGAADNLRRIDIDLWSLYEHRALREEGITSIDSFLPLQADFGGLSVTR
jgi:hypothetical protein